MDKIDKDKLNDALVCNDFNRGLCRSCDFDGEKCDEIRMFVKSVLTKLNDGEYVSEDYMHLMLKKQKAAKAKIDREKIKSIIFENLYEKEPLYLTIGKATNVSDKLTKAIMSELDNK